MFPLMKRELRCCFPQSSWYHRTTLQKCARWYICNCPILWWWFMMSWRQIGATSPAATMRTTQCIIATSSDRHGISNYRPIECLFNIFFRLPTKKYLKSTLPSLCEDSIVIGGSPHKRRVTWKTSLFDDVIMDWRIPWGRKYHVTQYTRCITAIKQTMLERGRNVDIPLVSLLSLGSIP